MILEMAWLSTADTLQFLYGHLGVLPTCVAHRRLQEGTPTCLSLWGCSRSCGSSINRGGRICHTVQPWVPAAPARPPQREPGFLWGEGHRGLLAAVASSLSCMEGVGSHMWSYTESCFSPFSGSSCLSNLT